MPTWSTTFPGITSLFFNCWPSSHSWSVSGSRPCSPPGKLTIRALAGSSVQRRVPMAVLVGRVSPKPKQQAQGGGIVAGTGPVQWWGLPSVYVKAWVSLEEGLGPDQASCRQVTTEATLSALAAGSGGHGSLGLRKKDKKAAVRAPALPGPSPPIPDIPSCSSLRSPFFLHLQQEMRPLLSSLSQMIGLKKILKGAWVTDFFM